MKTEQEIRELVESIWNRETKKVTADGTGVVKIYQGWSTKDENDPDRYWMESYSIGGPLPVVTGRGGMKSLLEVGYIPFEVYVNGNKMDVDDFLTQFKNLTHE